MRIVFDGKTPYFPVQVLQSTEAFPGALPLVRRDFQPLSSSGGYFGKKVLDINRRYNRSLHETLEVAEGFTDAFNLRINQFDSLLTDYDKEVVLPTTCGLGYQKPAHTDFDALGYLGLDTDFEYPIQLEDAVVEYYKKYLIPETDDLQKISLPRGKNIGYPYPIGGRKRELSDALLAISVALVQGAEAGGIGTLDGLYDFLRKYHGPAFTQQGERYQHTGKEMPIVVQDGVFSSTNFEPRVRVICMSPKVSIVKMRTPVKRFLYTLMAAPEHTQDRDAIQTRIDTMLRDYKTVIAVDASKFDFRHGGKRGKQMLRIISRVLDDDRFLEDAYTDFDTELVVYGHKRAYKAPGDVLLKSGMGTTTLIGCVGNKMATSFALQKVLGGDYRKIVGSVGEDYDLLAWGDDGVLALKSDIPISDLQAAYKECKMEVEPEPTLKFLGYNYDKGDFAGSMDIGYSVGRAIQQQFFPERPKLYPFSTVGYIARLELMTTRGKDFHNMMLKHWDDNLGEKFSFDEKGQVLRDLIPEIQKQAEKLQQMDDILNIFTHGIQEIDPDLISISDDMAELLGTVGTVDVTDPIEFMREYDVAPTLIPLIAKFLKGDLNIYPQIVYDIQRIFNLNWKAGGVIY